MLIFIRSKCKLCKML